MHLKNLELNNFRNYKNVNLNFDRNTILIIGDNGQGKTNLLESIYYISTGKSHRTNDQDEMINWDSDFAILRASVNDDSPDLTEGSGHLIEVELRRENNIKIRIDEAYTRRKSDFTSILPSVIFSPGDLKIIKSGPANRRDFLDDMLERIYRDFAPLKLQYQKILNQRNSLLKSITNEEQYRGNLTLEVWDENLVNYGSSIIERRCHLLDEIKKNFIDCMNYFFPDIKADIFYLFSWDKSIAEVNNRAADNYSDNGDSKGSLNNNTGDNINVSEGKSKEKVTINIQDIKENFYTKLKENLRKDINYKNTMIGPHRDDLIILINGKDLRSFGSQGQQRIAAICLKFSEFTVLEEKLKKTPVLLLDDVLSELDLARKKLLINMIGNKFQTFITSSNISYLDDVDEKLINKFQVKDNSISIVK
jgi:DNA replication and repair protein RecF